MTHKGHIVKTLDQKKPWRLTVTGLKPRKFATWAEAYCSTASIPFRKQVRRLKQKLSDAELRGYNCAVQFGNTRRLLEATEQKLKLAEARNQTLEYEVSRLSANLEALNPNAQKENK